jgi:hypothetical protein
MLKGAGEAISITVWTALCDSGTETDVMKKLLGVLLGLAIFLSAVGFFRGWFSLSTTVEETTTTIHLLIDRQRIKEDVDLAREKVGALGDRIGGENENVQDQGGVDYLNPGQP